MDQKSNIITKLNELYDAIKKGDIDKVKQKVYWFYQDWERNKKLLRELHTSGEQRVTQTDLIIKVCHKNEAEFNSEEEEAELRYKLSNILYYLLFETDFLELLPGADFDDTEEKLQRTEAFKEALSWDAFTMVELLYDYWIGDLHWIGHEINKIKTLGEMLEASRDVCAVENQQLLVDIHCIIKFNDFQKELYSEISKIEKKEIETMIEKLWSISDKYLDFKVFILKNEVQEKQRKIAEDETSDYMKIRNYIKHWVYYRKLHFNVALLLLGNRSVLEEHFEKEDKDIKITLFNFIYHICENWKPYLPTDREITIEKNHTGIHNGVIRKDRHKEKYGPVLFLEQKSFYEHVRHKKKILSTTEKYDKLLFTDYYSLRRIKYYLNAIDTEKSCVLIIKRVLQVTGEMLKSTKRSHHLSEDTKSILQIAMSVENVNNLIHIRDHLTHPERGYIDENSQNQGFNNQDWEKIKQDLTTIKPLIDSILDIYKPILERSILEKGKRLLDERIKNLPQNAAQHIDEIYGWYDTGGENLLHSELQNEKDLFQDLSKQTGLEHQLLCEILWIRKNRDDIESKIESTKTSIDQQIVQKLPTYIQNIRQILQLSDRNNQDVDHINPLLENLRLKKLPNNFKKIDINDRIGKVEKYKRNNKKADVHSLLQTLERMVCLSEEWKAINNMLSFCYDTCKLLGTKPQIVNGDEASAITMLKELDVKCRSILKPEILPRLDGTAIKKLNDYLDKNEKAKMSREMRISFLINRVNLLKGILKYSHNIDQQVHYRQYMHDRKFRLKLEMLLADIANIFNKVKNKKFIYKSSKLLRDTDLGNVLDHGNPFFDVIANAFDRKDVPTALFSIARMFAKDGKAIEALYELLKDKTDYDTIKEELSKTDNMNEKHKKNYDLLRESPNRKLYLDLIEME